MTKYLNTRELCEVFGLSRSTVEIICKQKGSKAFKTGDTARSEWRCSEEDFKQMLMSASERWKK